MSPLDTRPETVAMIGLGPSYYDYVSIAGCKKDFLQVDEVWGVNSTMGVFEMDKCFIMDDLKTVRKNYPEWAAKIASTKTPVITARAYEEFPTSIAYPLEEVMANVKDDYFTTTVAYMVAYAMYIKVREMYLFGMDFHYPGGNAKEPGAEAVAYLLGMAKERGINYRIPQHSTLLDANLTKVGEDGRPHRPLYGFDYNPGASKRRVEQGIGDELDKQIAHKAPYMDKKGEQK